MEPAPPPVRVVPPPSIMHLLLWTFFSACLIAAAQQYILVHSLTRGINSRISQTGEMFNNGIILGAVLTGLTVLGCSRLGERRLRLLPGHFLLMQNGMFGLTGFVLVAAYLNLAGTLLGIGYMLCYALLHMAGGVLYVVAMRHVTQTRWQRFFLAESIVTFIGAGIYINGTMYYFSPNAITPSAIWLNRFVFYIAPISSSVLLVWLIGLAMRDAKDRRGLDWLHWLGLVTRLAVWSISLFHILMLWNTNWRL